MNQTLRKLRLAALASKLEPHEETLIPKELALAILKL